MRIYDDHHISIYHINPNKKKQSSWLNCTILVGYLIEAQEWGPKGW